MTDVPTSYPFLKIARHFFVPYGTVLRMTEPGNLGKTAEWMLNNAQMKPDAMSKEWRLYLALEIALSLTTVPVADRGLALLKEKNAIGKQESWGC